MLKYCAALATCIERTGEPADPFTVTFPFVDATGAVKIASVPLLTTVVPEKVLTPLKVIVPPPVLLSPPTPVRAPDSAMLNGLLPESADWKVIFPLRLVRVIGNDDDQFAVAP